MPAYGSIPNVSREEDSSSDQDEDEPAVIQDALSFRHGEEERLLQSTTNSGGENGAAAQEEEKLHHHIWTALQEAWQKAIAYLQDLGAKCWNDNARQTWWQAFLSTVQTFLQTCGSSICAAYAATATYVQDTLGPTLQSCSNNGVVAFISLMWSNLVFNWFTPVLYRGNAQNKLDPEDMDLVPFPDHCDTQGISNVFYEHWNAELSKQQQLPKNDSSNNNSHAEETNENNDHKHKKTTFKQPTKQTPSLGLALAYSFGREFCKAGILKLVHDACIFVGPQVLNAMIYYLRDADAPKRRGLNLTLFVTISQLCMSFCLRHYFFSCYMVGLKIRTAVVVAVYQKALVLAAGERQTRTVGEITNLMSIDAKRLQDLTTYLHAIWYTIFQISLALFFLWKQLGASCLGGVVVMIVMMPVTKFVAKWMAARQKRVMKAKDERVEINCEVLANIKVIKLQAWEASFQSKILKYRAAELAQLWTYYVGSAASALLWNATPVAVAVATFAAYVLSGNELEVASALTALALFDILRFPLFMLPQIVNRIVEAGVSLHRIESFLLCKEHELVPPGSLETNGVDLCNVSAAYESKKPRLNGVDIDPKAKELVDNQWETSLVKSQLAEAEQKIKDLVSQQEKMAEALRCSQRQAAATHNDSADEWEDLDQKETFEPVVDTSTGPSSVATFDSAQADTHGNDVESPPSNLLSLKRVDFQCNEGELIAVVGFVGSGKSTLINTLLGEVRMLSGTSAVRGSLSYFSQQPFILNATVRDNILFGHINDEEIDETLYQRALECCALKHDLEMLSHGDQTEIGERGVTLSGGQKARVALARAVYHNADISLIDDALSAVDAHVAKHLFHQCVVDELLTGANGKQRCVILVTNALQFLSHPRVNKIVVVNDGRIVEQGNYQELARQPDSLFARFLHVINETGIKATGHEEDDVSLEAEQEDAGTNEGPTRRRSSAMRRSSGEKRTSESKSATGSERPTKKTTTMTEEARSIGHVGKEVYLAWARAAGGYWVPFALVLLFGFVEGINVLSKWWLTYWSSHAASGSQIGFLEVYALINLGFVCSTFFAMVLLIWIGMKASQNFFAQMLDTMLRAPMSFFDTTPIGRIINRFSKDMYTIDEELVMTLRMYIRNLAQILSTILVISGVSPAFTATLIPIILFYIKEQSFFTITYRELKRLDSVNRSPLYALLGETVDGVATIRAFSAQDALVRRLKKFLDLQQHAYFLTCTAQCWLAVRLEVIGTLIITFACLSAVIEHEAVNGDETRAGLFGLAISFSLSITQSLNWSVRMASDFEAQMVAVERVKDYCELDGEADRYCDGDKALGADSIGGQPSWPRGEIEFQNAKLRYRPELPLVLKGLDIHIPAGSKVGVVGRTGAGKSTLMIALLRLVELDSGKIMFDGVDARTVGLAALRSKIAVIPQDPVLFSGTIRTNLDPFGEFSTKVLYGVLHRVGLYYTTGSSVGYGRDFSSASLSSMVSNCQVQSLQDIVSEGGINFSVGQRQLVVIARALLCGASIVIMDEATAAVDADTDARIQSVMRTEFVKATCITVAHRLNTIMDSDYILVMDDGRAAEFDKPKVLLKKTGGLFRELVDASTHTGI